MSISLKKDIVYENLKRDILTRKLVAGEKMSSGIKLAEQFGVSHITLRGAMKRLEAERLVTQIHGRGIFVANNSLKSNKTKNFLILSELGFLPIESPASYIIPACEKLCAQLEIGTSNLPWTMFHSDSKNRIIDYLLQYNYDGILFMGCNFKDGKEDIGEILLELDIPVIVPQAHPLDKEIFPQFATIETDAKLAWSEGIIHLIKQGHHKIGTLDSCDEYSTSLRGFKRDEYLNFLRGQGADSDPELIVGVNYYSDESFFTKIKKLMDTARPPTAIMCYSDFFAIKAYNVLKKLNIRIPEQVAVMGYCGYPGGNLLLPSLSTVDRQYDKIGQLAVKLLNSAEEWFNRDAATPHVTLSHILIARESTALKSRCHKPEIINVL